MTDEKPTTKIDVEQLQELYPTPKTYEQKKEMDIRRQQRYNDRRPKYPAFRGSLALSIVFYGILFFFANIGTLWGTPNGGSDNATALAVAFIGLAFGLVILFALVGALKYMTVVLSAYGRARPTFFVPFLCIALVLGFGVVEGWYGTLGGSFQLFFVSVLHLVALYIFLRALLRTSV
jgi:hypothetical protein